MDHTAAQLSASELSPPKEGYDNLDDNPPPEDLQSVGLCITFHPNVTPLSGKTTTMGICFDWNFPLPDKSIWTLEGSAASVAPCARAEACRASLVRHRTTIQKLMTNKAASKRAANRTQTKPSQTSQWIFQLVLVQYK